MQGTPQGYRAKHHCLALPGSAAEDNKKARNNTGFLFCGGTARLSRSIIVYTKILMSINILVSYNQIMP